MNGYAELQAYDSFIAEIQNFCRGLEECCATLIKSGQLMVDGTDGKDLTSLKAQKKLAEVAKEYQVIIQNAQNLASQLGVEREEVARLLQEANNI